MLQNKLKLNDSKMEFLTFLPSSKEIRSTNCSTISIGEDEICLSRTAKNLGLVLDDQLSLSDHITSICKDANF